MKKLLTLLSIITITLLTTSCSWVKPNYAGILMQNYGKNGKSDFTLITGKVSTIAPGTELLQVPLFEQRGEYSEPLHLKAADNTEFTSNPTYSYKVIKDKAVDVVFNNKQLGSGDDFLEAVENNILEMRIRDIIKEASRRYTTDTLMGTSGSLHFEEKVQELVKKSFADAGFELLYFSCQLDFPEGVKQKINQRNEVNQDQLVVDQQIDVAKKKIELAKLNAQVSIEQSKGITEEILRQQFIDKWDGHTPLYGNMPVNLIKQVK
jgi:hypothetical protein